MKKILVSYYAPVLGAIMASLPRELVTVLTPAVETSSPGRASRSKTSHKQNARKDARKRRR